MLEDRRACRTLLRCPVSGRVLTQCTSTDIATESENGLPAMRYPLVNDLPILVDFASSVLDRDTTLASAAQSPVLRANYRWASAAMRRLTSSTNKKTTENLATLEQLLLQQVSDPLVLVVGGGVVGSGCSRLYDHQTIRVVAFDIYCSPHVQFVADAHRIPLPDATFDAVVVQAVLEHVLEPQRVVQELIRVLKPGGYIYAETPFMQQVHEGPYDFTRFTDSGHRNLLRRFDRLNSGALDAAGTQLMWSVEYFTRSLLRSHFAGKVAKAAFSWLRFFDRLIPDTYAVDGATGVFFLGQLNNNQTSPREAIGYYQGAQRTATEVGGSKSSTWTRILNVRGCARLEHKRGAP